METCRSLVIFSHCCMARIICAHRSTCSFNAMCFACLQKMNNNTFVRSWLPCLCQGYANSLSLALWPALPPPRPLPQSPIDLPTFNCVLVLTSTCEVIVSAWKLVVKICKVAIDVYEFVAPKCTPKCALDAIIQRSCSFYKLLQVSTQQSASSRFDETKCSFKFLWSTTIMVVWY